MTASPDSGDQPAQGITLDGAVVEDGGTIVMGACPQVEVAGVLAFVLDNNLAGFSLTGADLLSATSCLVPAIEIVGAVGDEGQNLLVGMFGLGSTRISLDEVDLRLVGMTLRRNGSVASTGSGAASMGNPVASVAWIVNEAMGRGESIDAGAILLSAPLGPAVTVEPGDWVEVRIGARGRVGLRFELGAQ